MRELLVDGQVVQLHNVDANTPLTPSLARSAARIAFGGSVGRFVCDGTEDGAVGYKLTRTGARKFTMVYGEWL